MRPTAIILLVTAALLGYGSVSYHWFDDSYKGITSYQGLVAAETCGLDLGDSLEKYGRYLESGVVEPGVYRCEIDFVPPMIAEVRHGIDVVWWLALMIGFVAGVATCVMALVAAIRLLRGGATPGPRGRLWLSVLPCVGLVCPVAVYLIGDLDHFSLGRGAIAYTAGAVLAVVAARRLRRS